MNITAYTYNAAAHCQRCTFRYFRVDVLKVPEGADPLEGATDSQGNAPGVIFSTDENAAGYCDTCGLAYGGAAPVARLLFVDAWREPGGGWTWNNWHARGFVPLAWCDLTPRRLFAELRKMGVLAPAKFCRAPVAREDDGYNVLIVTRGTREPLIAIEYGAVQP